MATEHPLAGKAAIVTGASAGIGRESARALAAAGADVALAARREERLEALADAIESDTDAAALVAPTDVTDAAAVEALVDRTADRFGRVDVVVSNAGTGPERGSDVETLDLQQYRTVMAVNTDGMFHTARAALPHLRETAGILIFVSSFAGLYPRPSAPVYAASKWWTRGFALSLAGHVGGDDVGVTVINPSEVRTEFGKDFRAADDLHKERFGPGEITEPEDVAAAVVFAAQQEPPNVVTELDLHRRDKLAHF